MSRRRLFVQNALTWAMALTVCAVVAHFATNALVSYATYRLGLADPVIPAPTSARSEAKGPGNGEAPRDSLFHASKKGDGAPAGEAAPLSADGLPLAPQTVGIALAGTMVRTDGADNMAVIIDKKSGKQDIFHEGDMVGNVLIKRILRHKIIIEDKGSAFVLIMPFKGGERAASPPRQAAPPQNAPKNPG